MEEKEEEDWYATQCVGHRGEREDENDLNEEKEEGWYVTQGCWP